MKAEHNEARGKNRELRWMGLIRFLLLVGFVGLLFLLMESMVHHHFFTGGSMNNHNAPTGP